jgi:predicted metal-dependent enzyme (double-stranded beta helix superfamily)
MLSDFVSRCQHLASVGAGPPEFAELVRTLVADPEMIAAEVGEPEVPSPVPIAGIDDTLYEDDTVTVMIVHVNPGIEQPPHDHLMPAIIGVYEGTEAHRFYNRTPEGLAPSGLRAIGAGEVISMGTEGVHAIAAADDNWARAIHVYLGSLSKQTRSMFDPDSFAEKPLTLDGYSQACRPLS